jgi:hypothetical protein
MAFYRLAEVCAAPPAEPHDHRATNNMGKNARLLAPIHPGEIIRRDSLSATAVEFEQAGDRPARVDHAASRATRACATPQSKTSVTILLFAKKVLHVFRSDAQRCTDTSVDARLPSAHNALTSLDVVLKANGRGPGKIPRRR